MFINRNILKAHLRRAALAAVILMAASHAQAATVTVQVGLGGDVYTPSSVTINANDTIHWVWDDDFHSVTSGVPGNPDNLWDSGVHNTGFEFSRAFPTSGTFPYYCSVHGACCNMKGSIIVSPALPALTVNNPRSLPEGSAAAPGSVTFDIALSASSNQTVTVNYHTTDNTATAGNDYVAKTGKLTFAPGETLKRVTIQFIGDSVPELNETFFFDLNTPANATIADNRGVGAINNDDGPGLSIADAAPVLEGDSGTIGQKFVVRLSAASANTVTVNWATANGTASLDDYVAASGTLTFAPGQTSKLITVQVKGDTQPEANETYKVNLSKPTFAVLTDSQGIGTIEDNDPVIDPTIRVEDEPSS